MFVLLVLVTVALWTVGCGREEVGAGRGAAGGEAAGLGKAGALVAVRGLGAGLLTHLQRTELQLVHLHRMQPDHLTGHHLAVLARHVVAVGEREDLAVAGSALPVTNLLSDQHTPPLLDKNMVSAST